MPDAMVAAPPAPLPQIVKHPHPALARAAPRVERIDAPEVIACLDALSRLLLEQQLLSLSAPQIGRSVRLFVIAPKLAETAAPLVFINPIILSAGLGMHRCIETCLSVSKPVHVKRATRVRVQARDVRGELFEVDAGDAPKGLGLSNGEATGFYARVLQHELDHLNGITTLRRRG